MQLQEYGSFRDQKRKWILAKKWPTGWQALWTLIIVIFLSSTSVLNWSEMNILPAVMNNHAINTYLIKINSNSNSKAFIIKIIAMPVCIHCIIADENVTCSFRLLVLSDCELHDYSLMLANCRSTIKVIGTSDNVSWFLYF